jgi:hypothetical protein
VRLLSSMASSPDSCLWLVVRAAEAIE